MKDIISDNTPELLGKRLDQWYALLTLNTVPVTVCIRVSRQLLLW